MDRNEVKNLKPGQPVRFVGDGCDIVVRFIKISGTGWIIISNPFVDGSCCPVEPHEIELVEDVGDLTNEVQ